MINDMWTDAELILQRIRVNQVQRAHNIEIDWDPTNEDTCALYISHDPMCIRWVVEPSVRLQQIAVSKDIKMISWVKQPDKELMDMALMNRMFIIEYPASYDFWIRQLFKDNELMLKKFIRYASNIRVGAELV